MQKPNMNKFIIFFILFFCYTNPLQKKTKNYLILSVTTYLTLNIINAFQSQKKLNTNEENLITNAFAYFFNISAFLKKNRITKFKKKIDSSYIYSSAEIQNLIAEIEIFNQQILELEQNKNEIEVLQKIPDLEKQIKELESKKNYLNQKNHYKKIK